MSKSNGVCKYVECTYVDLYVQTSFQILQDKKSNQFSKLCKIASRIMHEISPELPLERFL